MKQKNCWHCTSGTDWLPGMPEALGLIHNIIKKKKKEMIIEVQKDI
jgi:hypothetical protein